jgi:hypothetical protein
VLGLFFALITQPQNQGRASRARWKTNTNRTARLTVPAGPSVTSARDVLHGALAPGQRSFRRRCSGRREERVGLRRGRGGAAPGLQAVRLRPTVRPDARELHPTQPRLRSIHFESSWQNGHAGHFSFFFEVAKEGWESRLLLIHMRRSITARTVMGPPR